MGSKDTTTRNMATTALPTTTISTTTIGPVYNCTSTRQLENGVVAGEKKGFCVDDTTFTDCPEEFFGLWPHATERVKSYRLFAAWKPDWKGDRVEAWKELKVFLDRTNSTVLLGAEIQSGNDCDEQFQWALELLKLLGRERVVAFAFGNEIDYHGADSIGYWEMVLRYSKEIDDAGFEEMPLTTVFSQQILAKMRSGFYADLCKKMADTFKKRWVWSYNTYSIWDSSVRPHSGGDCDKMVEVSTGIKYIMDTTKVFRDQVTAIMGHEDYELWITETGWSSPVVRPEHNYIEGFCPKFGSEDSLYNLYKNVAEWDLSLGDDKKGVDRVYYFAMRDHYFEGEEAFGMVKRCGDTACKVAGGKASEVTI